jgi:hypothetical protein
MFISEVLQAGFAERGSRVAGASKPRLLRRSRGGPMPTRGAGQARPRAPVQAARPPGHKRGGSAEPPTAASGKRTKAAVAKRHARESYEDDPPAAAARSSKPAAAARKRAAKRSRPDSAPPEPEEPAPRQRRPSARAAGVNLGDAAELVRGLIAAEGPLWLGLVATTASGELSPRSADLAMRRGGLERWRREAALHAGWASQPEPDLVLSAEWVVCVM